MPIGEGRKKSFVDAEAIGGSRFAVIGLGEFGRAVALGLAEEGAEVMAIDRAMAAVEAVKKEVARAIQFDATDVEALRTHGLEEMDAVVVAIGGDFEATLLVSVELMQLGTERVLARAYTATQRHILERLGVHEILAPEAEMGHHVAMLLRRPGLVDYFDLSDGYAVMEVNVLEKFVGKRLDELNLPREYGVTIITVRRPVGGQEDEEGEVEREAIGVPRSDTTLQKDDTLVLFGRAQEVDALINGG